MKTYKGNYSNGQIHVTVNGQPISMARPPYDNRVIPFSLENNSDGAERLTFSLLADCLGSDFDINSLWCFMNEILVQFDAEWEITSDDIKDFFDHKRAMASAIGYAPQNAEWTPVSSSSPKRASFPILFPPKIISDPNYRLKSKEVSVN